MNLTELAVKTVYWFFLYGFIGWGVEVVYAAVKTHKLVNRGFLCGPICPIYGFGMVGLIYSVSLIPMPDSGSMSAVAIFFIGMILTTAIELVGGWALFKIYHIRWWDYSNMKFNLGGYICPQFSLLWGLGSVLMIKVVHPLLARGSSPMPFNIMLIVDVVLLVLFVVDVAASTAAAIGLNKYLREIDELRAKLRVTSDKLTTVLGTGAMTADTILDEQKLQLALAKLEGRENADVLRAELTIRVAALREKLTAAEHDHLGTRRLLRAFPDMKSLNYADTLAANPRRHAPPAGAGCCREGRRQRDRRQREGENQEGVILYQQSRPGLWKTRAAVLYVCRGRAYPALPCKANRALAGRPRAAHVRPLPSAPHAFFLSNAICSTSQAATRQTTEISPGVSPGVGQVLHRGVVHRAVQTGLQPGHTAVQVGGCAQCAHTPAADDDVGDRRRRARHGEHDVAENDLPDHKHQHGQYRALAAGEQRRDQQADAAGREYRQQNRDKDFHIRFQQQVVLRHMHNGNKAQGQDSRLQNLDQQQHRRLAQHDCGQADADGCLAQDDLALPADLAVGVQRTHKRRHSG